MISLFIKTIFSLFSFVIILKIINNFINSFSINNYQYIKVNNIKEFQQTLIRYSNIIKNIYENSNGDIRYNIHCHCKYILNKDIIQNDDGTYDLTKAIDYNGESIINKIDQSYDFPIIIIVPNDNEKHIHINWKSFIIKVLSLDFKFKN